MKAKTIIAILAWASATLWAAADDLRWLSTEYDFGTIREEAGKAHGQVQFVNSGTEATTITRVKSTCGCTGVGHTEGIIAPGDTATVWFDYNPAGRPGRFLKHVKVYTGTGNDLTSVAIKGTVIGAPRSLESKYPVVAGDLRLSADVIPMGKTVWGTSRHEYLHGYNQGTDTLRLSWKDMPPYISLGASGLNIAPGDLFTLSAYMNTRDGAEIGSMDTPFTLTAHSGSRASEIEVHIVADIVPDTSGYTEQELREAPFASVFPTIVDLGDTGIAKKPRIEFAVKNEGKTPLSVKRIHCPQIPGLLKVKSMPKNLKPGEWKPVKGMIDPASLPAGNFKIAVEVVTDDPLHPTRTVHIIGTGKNHDDTSL